VVAPANIRSAAAAATISVPVPANAQNALDIRENFRATIPSGQGAVEQWRYTVPSGRRASIELGGVFAQNAQGGDQACSIRDQFGPIIAAHSGGLSQGAYASEQQNLDFQLDAGEYLFAQTTNNGNSGSDQSAWLYAVEYDAVPATTVACISVHPVRGDLVVVRMAISAIVAWGTYIASDSSPGQAFIATLDSRWEVTETLAQLDAMLGASGQPPT